MHPCEYLDCFFLLATVNSAAMNIHVQVSVWVLVLCCFGYTPMSGIARPYGSSITFWGPEGVYWSSSKGDWEHRTGLLGWMRSDKPWSPGYTEGGAVLSGVPRCGKRMQVSWRLLRREPMQNVHAKHIGNVQQEHEWMGGRWTGSRGRAYPSSLTDFPWAVMSSSKLGTLILLVQSCRSHSGPIAWHWREFHILVTSYC